MYQGYGGAEEHKGEFTNVIVQFEDDIDEGEVTVIYGDGTLSRDFTHVNEIVHGLELAAEHQLTGIYNLGTGEGYDFNTVVEMLNAKLGTNIEPEYVENPIPDDVYVHDMMSDTTAIYEATGWKQEISFEEGIKRVYGQNK